MKNRVSKAWSKDNAETYNTNQITKADKELFRPYLIQVLIVASPTIRVQFTAILSKILASDYPTRWPEFQDLTLGLLQSGNINEVYAGLTMLLELTKIYRWKSGDNRSGLEAVVTNIFPVILQIAGKLLVDPNIAAATMLVLILKTYKSAIAVRRLLIRFLMNRWSCHPNCQKTQYLFHGVICFFKLLRRRSPCRSSLQRRKNGRHIHGQKRRNGLSPI